MTDALIPHQQILLNMIFPLTLTLSPKGRGFFGITIFLSV